MLVDSDAVTEWVLSVLKEPDARDKQTRVGPSALGDPCSRCLADRLLEVPEGDRDFWLGAVNGKAIHAYFGERATEYGRPEIRSELKVIVGDLPGYGEISGTTDIYLPDWKFCGDLKTTTRKHLAAYKRIVDGDTAESLTEERHRFNTYLGQLFTYARGMIAAGNEVESVGLIFLCRDGMGDNDIWSHVLPYDKVWSDKILARAEALYRWLNVDGGDPNQLDSAPGCWYCMNERPIRKELVAL